MSSDIHTIVPDSNLNTASAGIRNIKQTTIGITDENLLNQLDTTKKEQLYSNEVYQPKNESISTVVTSAKLRSNQFSYFSYIVVLMTTVLLAFATRWYKISAGKFVL